MRVKRDFEQIYATEDDPWGIGDADSERYDRYVERVLAESRNRGSILELGCGFGALLARFRGEFNRLVGVELSTQAVQRGRQRFPELELVQGSLADLDTALPNAGVFDTIIASDVLYYVIERDRQAAVGWIAEHLASDGLAFLAGWCPGGRYLTREEFRNLAARELAVEGEEELDTGHVILTCRRRRTLVALTVDYETWQPQPEGFVLDWETDVLTPTARLLDVFDNAGARLTLFAEMGEYLWLCDNRPQLAERMADQWRDAVRRGHDVQLHLHPNWLPEMNPAVTEGHWTWDMERSRAADYPGDLTAAIGRCKAALEQTIRPIDPTYEVVAYRAGTYEAQPFDRLYDALLRNDIWCDSSVLPGDHRPDRHYDYSHAYADHQPWFAARYDPQLKAPPSESRIVELPIFTPRRGERWTFDNEEGRRFADQLLEHLRRERTSHPTSEALRRRRKLRVVLNDVYVRLRRFRPLVSRLMPTQVAELLAGYEREQLVAHRHFVLVAHTKSALDYDAIARGVERLRQDPEIELVTLSELAGAAREELRKSVSTGPGDEAARQVQREYAAQMSDERNTGQSEPLRRLVPLDSERILDAGCGRGLGTRALADIFPHARVDGIDVGREFIERARAELADDRVSFRVENFSALSFPNETFDCVHADNSLEHAFDVDATLRELHRVVRQGGCLVAALPPDGLNPDRTCDNHTWKTTPADVVVRLRQAGFTKVDLRTKDLLRELHMPPFPPSRNRMLYVRAWKVDPDADPLERVRRLTSWAYRSLDPSRPQTTNDPMKILADGHAWCWGYVLVLGEAMSREGYEIKWITMVAEQHPLGVGPRRSDSHEVVEVMLPEGRRVVCDPMVGVVFEASLAELLSNPSRADVPRKEDERYKARNYALYSTSAWYRLVQRVAVRRRPNARLRFRTPN